jgi:hypothetical protein
MNICIFIWIHIWINLCIYVYMNIHLKTPWVMHCAWGDFIFISMYIDYFMYVCTYIYICIHPCICICIYINIGIIRIKRIRMKIFILRKSREFRIFRPCTCVWKIFSRVQWNCTYGWSDVRDNWRCWQPWRWIMYVYMYTNNIHMIIFLYTYVYVYIYMYVCVYIYICIYISGHASEYSINQFGAITVHVYIYIWI